MLTKTKQVIHNLWEPISRQAGRHSLQQNWLLVSPDSKKLWFAAIFFVSGFGKCRWTSADGTRCKIFVMADLRGICLLQSETKEKGLCRIEVYVAWGSLDGIAEDNHIDQMYMESPHR